MFLAEQYKFVPIYNYYDLSTDDATMPSDSIDMSGFHHATIYLQYHSIGTASPVLYAYSGATNGAQTSALTFNYAFGGAAAGTAVAGSAASCDVLTAWSTSAALTITHGTYDNYILVLEIPASIMDVANSEYFLTLNHTDPSTGCTGNVTACAILHPRYGSYRSATALA